jgi:hypothetical protein
MTWLFLGNKSLNFSMGQFKLLSPKTLLFPWGKWSLSCSLGQLKFLVPRNMIVPQGEKAISLKTNGFSMGKHMFRIVLQSYSFHVFLYSPTTCHGKGFKKGYNFVIGSISIKACMKKLWSHITHMHPKLLFLKEHVPKEELKLFQKAT